MKKFAIALAWVWAAAVSAQAQKPLVAYVNPFLGTAPLTNSAEIGSARVILPLDA